MKSAIERRERILEILSSRRSTTIDALANEFGVGEKTIRRDIETLSCMAPIYTVRGNGGGIRVDTGWYLGRKYLYDYQEELLIRLMSDLTEQDQRTMRSIIVMFAFPKRNR